MMKEYLEVKDGVATGGVFNNNPGIIIEDNWVEITNEVNKPVIGDKYVDGVWTHVVTPLNLNALIEEKSRLIAQSTDVINEYIEQRELQQLGVEGYESGPTITQEEYISWLKYREDIRNWDVANGEAPVKG